METIAASLLPLLTAMLLFRLLLRPVTGLARLCLRGLSGFACLWILNTTWPVTGFSIPINAVTVLMGGVLGLPGIALAALLQLI